MIKYLRPNTSHIKVTHYIVCLSKSSQVWRRTYFILKKTTRFLCTKQIVPCIPTKFSLVVMMKVVLKYVQLNYLSSLKTHQFLSPSKNKLKYVYFLPVGNIRQKHSGTWLNSSAVVTMHTIHTNTKSTRSF